MQRRNLYYPFTRPITFTIAVILHIISLCRKATSSPNCLFATQPRFSSLFSSSGLSNQLKLRNNHFENIDILISVESKSPSSMYSRHFGKCSVSSSFLVYTGILSNAARRIPHNNHCRAMSKISSKRSAAYQSADTSPDNSQSIPSSSISRNKTTQYFLLKSEPADYSIDDLQRDTFDEWNGIRNYQARNYLRTMNIGDRAFFYHSKVSKPQEGPGIVGAMRIARTAQPDASAYDPNHEYYDAKCTEENCKWDSVLVEFEEKFPVVLTLKEMKEVVKEDPGSGIAEMALFKQSRLSVVPLTCEEWSELMKMIEAKIACGNSLDEVTDGKNKKRRRENK